MYLEESSINKLLSLVSGLCVSGSRLLLDTIHSRSRDNEYGKAIASRMKAANAEWKYYCDDSEALVAPHGFKGQAKRLREVAVSVGHADRMNESERANYFFTLAIKQ